MIIISSTNFKRFCYFQSNFSSSLNVITLHQPCFTSFSLLAWNSLCKTFLCRSNPLANYDVIIYWFQGPAGSAGPAGPPGVKGEMVRNIRVLRAYHNLFQKHRSRAPTSVYICIGRCYWKQFCLVFLHIDHVDHHLKIIQEIAKLYVCLILYYLGRCGIRWWAWPYRQRWTRGECLRRLEL